MEKFRQAIIEELKKHTALEESVLDSALEVPPDSKLGDYAFPCFILSKTLRKNPAEISKELSGKFAINGVTSKPLGAYLNFTIDQQAISSFVIKEIQKDGENYGKGRKRGIALVESPGPNTNKPLHLGHLRNILLGSSIANLLRFSGKDVHIVNVVNDRGVHICKSMLAYQKWGNDLTPEKAGRKSDYFVGDFYVKYSQAEKDHPQLEKEVQEMLLKWEEGDKQTKELWAKMNRWALDGFAQTYKKLDFKIEKEYFESDTYLSGKEIILDGLKKGIFLKDGTGAIIVDLEDKGMGKKVLIRSNGTSVYITQDIYMAKKRYEVYSFDQMIYVVGNEQEFHFKVLFELFRKLGWRFSDGCYHFSYGMVELPEGKMKSREGNVVDIDDLLEEVKAIAEEELKARYPALSKAELEHRTKVIAMAAIRFFFLRFDPLKNFVFNPKESLAFEGETGPYVLYAYARICSIFKKLEGKVDLSKADLSLLDTVSDKRVIMALAGFREIAESSASHYRPSLLTHYLFELSTAFTEYYHANPILKEEPKLRDARLALIDSVRTVLKTGLRLLDIDVIEEM
jgi:arginyl-tRNA synthetase